MKKRRVTAWFLLAVCMVMLIASVLPHHHHQEILCLQFNKEVVDEGCCHHHPDANDCSEQESHSKNACTSACVTHFYSVTPDRGVDDISPLYAFCILLLLLNSVFTYLLSLETKSRFFSSYLEKLHPACVPSILGLRGPPFI